MGDHTVSFPFFLPSAPPLIWHADNETTVRGPCIGAWGSELEGDFISGFFYRVTGKFSTPREYAVLVGVEGQSHGTGLTTPCTIQTPAEHCVGGNFLRTAQVQCTSDSPFCSCNFSKNSFIARTSQLSGKDTIVQKTAEHRFDPRAVKILIKIMISYDQHIISARGLHVLPLPRLKSLFTDPIFHEM